MQVRRFRSFLNESSVHIEFLQLYLKYLARNALTKGIWLLNSLHLFDKQAIFRLTGLSKQKYREAFNNVSHRNYGHFRKAGSTERHQVHIRICIYKVFL